MIEKQVVTDLIEILEDETIQVRSATRLVEEGQVLAESYHRHVIHPGDKFEQEGERIKSLCQLLHTPAVVNAYKQKVAKVKP